MIIGCNKSNVCPSRRVHALEHTVIDPATETLVTLTRAADHYPAVNGRQPHASTVFRHALRGVDGVRLETIRVGGRLVTSIEAVARFIDVVAHVTHA